MLTELTALKLQLLRMRITHSVCHSLCSNSVIIKYHNYFTLKVFHNTVCCFCSLLIWFNSSKCTPRHKLNASAPFSTFREHTDFLTLITPETYRMLRSQQTASTNATTPLREVILISIEWRRFIQSKHSSQWITMGWLSGWVQNVNLYGNVSFRLPSARCQGPEY